MKLLLDTHVLLWWLDDSPQLSVAARELISEPQNVVFVSAASIWEIRIKEAIRKISVPEDFEQVLNAEPFERLSITTRHAHGLKNLPMHHADPFDRMLIVQAQLDDLTIVTHDELFPHYDVQCDVVGDSILTPT